MNSVDSQQLLCRQTAVARRSTRFSGAVHLPGASPLVVTELTVSSAYARCLIDLAVSRGANRQLLASRAEINLADLNAQDFRVPMDQYRVLMRVAKELAQDPALALHYGATVDMQEISVVGLLFH